MIKSLAEIEESTDALSKGLLGIQNEYKSELK